MNTWAMGHLSGCAAIKAAFQLCRLSLQGPEQSLDQMAAGVNL